MRLPNGFGSVHKLSGNRRKPYRARITTGWTDDAKQLYFVVGYFAKKSEAIQALSEYHSHPFDQKAKEYTYDALSDLWVKEREESGQSYSNQYKSAMARLKKALGSRLYAEIKTSDYQKVINDCDMGYSSKKAIRIVANLVNKYAIANGIGTVNYATLAQLPPQYDSRVHVPFTDEEMDKLWANSGDFKVQLILIYIYTGFRPTEFLEVRKENVFLQERYIMGGKKTAAGKNRAVPIAEKIYPFVERLYNHADGELLIANEDGSAMCYNDYRNHYFDPVMRQLCMEHLPHDSRHTCATLMDNKEINDKIRKLILGHRSTDVTNRVYTHKTIAQLVEAINKI